MLKTLRFFALLALLALAGGAQAQFLPLQEPRYTMSCYHKDNGWWKGPGTIGVSCQAAKIGDAGRAVALYNNLIVDYRNIHSSEMRKHLTEYTTRIVLLIQQIARDFYRDRALLEEREINDKEMSAWLRAVTAVAFQESYLSHFQFGQRDGRPADRLNILVGDRRGRDSGGRDIYRSKGMFQIQLSAHSEKGLFDLVHNIAYGIEYFYGRWASVLGFKGAPSRTIRRAISRCENRIRTAEGIDYGAVARSAYSAYNGGDGNVCRWTNEASQWAKNDRHFWNKYSKQPWREYFDNNLRLSLRRYGQFHGKHESRYYFGFDLECARTGLDLCKDPGHAGAYEQYLNQQAEGTLYKATLPSGEIKYCVWNNEQSGFACTDSEKQVPCLPGIARDERYFHLRAINIGNLAYIASVGEDRQSMCRLYGQGIATTGRFIRLRKNLKIRAQPDAASRELGIAAPDEIFQVLDFEIQPSTGFDRWYRVAFGSEEELREGYIYGGDELDHAEYVELIEDASSVPVERHHIPVAGDLIELTNEAPVYTEYAGFEKSAPLRRGEMIVFAGPAMVKDVTFFGEDEEILLEMSDFVIRVGQIKTHKSSIAAEVRKWVRVVGRRSEP